MHPLYATLGSLWHYREEIHALPVTNLQGIVNNAANALLSVVLDGIAIDDLTVVLLSMIVVIGNQILKTAETSCMAESEIENIICQTLVDLKSVTDQLMSETSSVSVESESDFVIEKDDLDDEYERHYYYKPKKTVTKWTSRSKKRPNHSKSVIETLKKWLHSHTSHPYPTEHQKTELCMSTGLSMLQLNNWFINARRRLLKG
jgi:hypothetical protein